MRLTTFLKQFNNRCQYCGKKKHFQVPSAFIMKLRFGKRDVRLGCIIVVGCVGLALVFFDYHAHIKGLKSSNEPDSRNGVIQRNSTGKSHIHAGEKESENGKDVNAAVKPNNKRHSDDFATEINAAQLDTHLKMEITSAKVTSTASDSVVKNLNNAKLNISAKGNFSTDGKASTIGDNEEKKFNFSAITNETCYQSPYFVCKDNQFKSTTNRTFHIAYLHKPNWQRAYVYDFSRCRFSNCVYQGDKINEDTDVVLVYGVRLYDSFTPPKRWPHQLYAFAVWEPPDRIGGTFLTNSSSVWNHAFNLTFTYRLDSDIPSVYFRLKRNPRPQEKRPNYYEIAQHKNRTAVWFVSRCKVPSRRADYVKQMQKYIDVDIFGRCGKKCTAPGDTCTEQLPQYKFYLSFENSLCTDYITEKLFKNFVQGRHIIPVVRGGGSYDQYFPKGLVVNAAHFKSPKDLALYLKDLGSDPVRYSQYLERKDSYIIGEVVHEREAGCDLCQYLNTREQRPKIYNLKEWYGDGHCKKATEISWPSD